MNCPDQLSLALQHKSAADRNFAEWAAANKQVIDWLAAEALQLQRSGFRHYSVKTLWEVARHHTALREGPKSKWKLNNSWTSRVARLLIQKHPELSSFFELRKLHN